MQANPITVDHESDDLIITEIYASVQGESSYTGVPCTFIRLSGCSLRCHWCDTVYGFKKGKTFAKAQVLNKIRELGVNLIEITGGEPLEQKASLSLMNSLVDEGYKVLLETSGAVSIKEVPPGVHIIMDLKCPGSGMVHRNLFENLEHLKPTDEIKFVIRDTADFDWMCAQIEAHDLCKRFQVLVSPSFHHMPPQDLVALILGRGLTRVRLNLQIHKYIWGPRAKGV